MIKLDVVDNGSQHFIVHADQPVRIEVSATAHGHIVAEVYDGARDDLHQEPVGCYDGTMRYLNRSWGQQPKDALRIQDWEVAYERCDGEWETADIQIPSEAQAVQRAISEAVHRGVRCSVTTSIRIQDAETGEVLDRDLALGHPPAIIIQVGG